MHNKNVFGDNVQISDYVHISAIEKVNKEKNVLMVKHVYILDNPYGYYDGCHCDLSPLTPPKDRTYKVTPEIIGDNAWPKEGVIVMPSVEISREYVIGDNSFINKSMPSNCVAIGSPAKVIKKNSQ